MVTGRPGLGAVAGSCGCPHHSGKEYSNASHLLDSDSCSFSFQELVFSASPDATIRIWSVPNTSCVQVVRAHESAVTGLSLHATGDYLLSSSDDQVHHSQGALRDCFLILGGGTIFLGVTRFPEFWKCFLFVETNSVRGY